MNAHNSMWLIVGLGNPGDEYRSTRHNIGFLAVDALAPEAKFGRKFSGELAQAELGGEKILLLKPQTYMNHSGRSVQAAMAFYKLKPEQLIVLHDELDLPLGRIRIKQGGGDNGHNGIRDIDACIGKEYWRVRIGIGHPGDAAQVHGHVLSSFSAAEKKEVKKILAALAEYFPLFWQHSPQALMSRFADALRPAD